MAWVLLPTWFFSSPWFLSSTQFPSTWSLYWRCYWWKGIPSTLFICSTKIFAASSVSLVPGTFVGGLWVDGNCPRLDVACRMACAIWVLLSVFCGRPGSGAGEDFFRGDAVEGVCRLSWSMCSESLLRISLDSPSSPSTNLLKSTAGASSCNRASSSPKVTLTVGPFKRAASLLAVALPVAWSKPWVSVCSNPSYVR